jgi:hypothetical protein
VNRFEPSRTFDELVGVAAEPGYVDVAGQVVRVARRSNNDDTGGYDKSLRVTVDERGVVAETTDFAGHIIEWGRAGQSPQAPIRTGAAAAGKFDPA